MALLQRPHLHHTDLHRYILRILIRIGRFHKIITAILAITLPHLLTIIPTTWTTCPRAWRIATSTATPTSPLYPLPNPTSILETTALAQGHPLPLPQEAAAHAAMAATVAEKYKCNPMQ